MRRAALAYVFLVVLFGAAPDVSAQIINVEGQNRFRLYGEWRITIKEIHDDFSFRLQAEGQPPRRNYDSDDVHHGAIATFTVDDMNPLGWLIEAEDVDGEDGPGVGYMEILSRAGDTWQVGVEITHGAATHPYDDVILEFELIAPLGSVPNCILDSNSEGLYYICNGRRISQISPVLRNLSTWGDVLWWQDGDGGPWYANERSTGTPDTIRQITQSTSDAFLVSGTIAAWRFAGNLTQPRGWYANDLLSGTVATIHPLTQNAQAPVLGPLLVTGGAVLWSATFTNGQSGWFVRCLADGPAAITVPVTDLVGPNDPWRSIEFFRTVGGSAFWTYRSVAGAVQTSVLLPECARSSAAVDATLATVGGTAIDTSPTMAAVHVAAGVLPTFTAVGIDVLSQMDVPPVYGFRSEVRTAFVEIALQPALTSPLPAPGISLTLPLEGPLPAGLSLALFEVDPDTGLLVPKLGANGQQILGSVDAGGTTATFNGVTTFSLFVGMAINKVPTANAGSDRTLECCGAVTLDASASSDPDGDSLTYRWSGDFGTLAGPVVSVNLGWGSHPITLTVDDGHGGVSTAVVTITMNDTVAPRVTTPPNQAAGQTSSAGAIVTYPAPTVLEAGSGLASSGCLPASGAVFPAGTTTVMCTAVDRAGNAGAASFIVTVTAGPPALTAVSAGVTTPAAGRRTVTVRVTNTGTGNALNVTVTLSGLRTLAGTGTPTLVSGLPAAIPILAPGSSVDIPIVVNVPSTVLRLAVSEALTMADFLGTRLSTTATQTIFP